MEIRHFLIDETKDSTLSAMYVDGVFFGFILEDGERETKVYGKTRVDGGGPYRLTPAHSGQFYQKYKAKYSHQFSILVNGFPRHSGIMYHLLNEVTETNGCFGPALVGGRYLTKSLHYVRNSEPVYLRLYNALERIYDPVKKVFTEDVDLFIHRESPWQILKGAKIDL